MERPSPIDVILQRIQEPMMAKGSLTFSKSTTPALTVPVKLGKDIE